MPLDKSMGLSTMIGELMNSYKDKGMIGTSIPKNKTKAQKQAIAISYKAKGLK